MRKAKRRRLETAGWRVGGPGEFLELSDEEAAIVEVRVQLARILRETRVARSWTQTQLADLMGSSQSRIAKMEAADGSVSLDLLVRSLIVSGASGQAIGSAFAAIRGRKATKRPA